MKIEKLGDYKKAMKAFVKGLIKAKVFLTDDSKLIMNVSKDEDTKSVVASVIMDSYAATFDVEVSTRVFNKVDEELFEPMKAQFNKLKGFGGFEVIVK